MKRKQLLLILVITLLFITNIYALTCNKSSIITAVLGLIICTVLSISLILRKKLQFKSWALNKRNFLLAKEVRIMTSDIPCELLFEKLIDVIEESDFDLADSDKNSFQLLATTFPNFYTWGENMYIEISETENNNSEIKFTSVTIFGYSWNRNKKNLEKFFQLFEESLTI
jgi:hypothetical protein